MSDYVERDFRKFSKKELIDECKDVEKAILVCFPDWESDKWSIFDWMRHIAFGYENMLKEGVQNEVDGIYKEIEKTRVAEKVRARKMVECRNTVRSLTKENDKLKEMLLKKVIRVNK
jgi:hypothetical protein